jgi:hypothetical protein
MPIVFIHNFTFSYLLQYYRIHSTHVLPYKQFGKVIGIYINLHLLCPALPGNSLLFLATNPQVHNFTYTWICIWVFDHCLAQLWQLAIFSFWFINLRSLILHRENIPNSSVLWFYLSFCLCMRNLWILCFHLQNGWKESEFIICQHMRVTNSIFVRYVPDKFTPCFWAKSS